ncbi:DUF4390 domain-containing protein [uncultured Aquitalea sp.]|uniref:DUF4390 domain-containing protein n=1 Tax=uncultured Aquitalea sp. TaxID=540272 RepID=UPI0025E37ACD|nr:DUF4390 domain-containing protein [uncultured Aquitalea sp.]
MRNISLCIWLLACTVMTAQAEGIVARRAEAELTPDGQLSVSSRFQTRLPNSLSDALQQGVTLTFRLEFQLTKPRSTAYYLDLKEWFDPHASLAYKLSYQPLTSRYRVTIGSFSNYYGSLNEAMGVVGAIQDWRVLDNGALDPKSPGKVAGRIRLVLDIGELPKPFQLNALGSSDWSLSSNWTSLNVKEGG